MDGGVGRVQSQRPCKIDEFLSYARACKSEERDGERGRRADGGGNEWLLVVDEKRRQIFGRSSGGVACSVTLKRNVCLDLYNPTLVSCRARERCDISYLYIKPSRSFREKRWKVCAPRSLPFLIRFSVSRSSSCRRNFSCAKIARSFIQLMVTYEYIYIYIYIYIYMSRSRNSDSLFIKFAHTSHSMKPPKSRRIREKQIR